MPPKRAKVNQAAASDAAPSIGVLLARCSRGDLERLLEESVLSKQACTYAKVQAALPEAKQAVVIARPKVASGQTRDGTGYFDALDDELLIDIFSQVASTATRLSSAIAVCKAWRSALARAELFTNLDLSASYYSYGGSNAVAINSSNLPRLLKWLPTVSAVTSLKLNMGDKHKSIAPDVVKRALPLFTGLTDLEIRGKKTTAALLSVLAKQPYCANLTSFEMGDCSAKPEDALPLLVSAARLLTLKVNFGFGGDNDHFLRSLSNGWRAKRGGDATPLLTTFETSGYSGSNLALATFISLADQFPELSTLRAGLNCSYVRSVMPDEFISCYTPLAQLRELYLSTLIQTFGGEHLTSEQLHNVLRIICHVAPSLTKLKLHHGTMYVSVKDQKGGRRVDAHPAPNGALDLLPSSLISLDLGTMMLGPSDFETATLGALKHLTLNKCGPHAQTHATALCARCPLLEPKRCFTSELKPTGPYGGFRLVCLDPMEEAKRMEAEAAIKAARSSAIHCSVGAAGSSASGAAGTSASGASGSPVPIDDEGFKPMEEEEGTIADDNGDE